MKITIAFTQQEEAKAERILRLLLGVLPGSVHRTSARHAPYLHIYIKDKSGT